MSTRVGTLQAPRAGGSILLAAFLASFVVMTIVVVAISLDRNQGRQGETTFVGRHVVNTPSELNAGVVGGAEQTSVGGTAANTPSELNAQIRRREARDGRRRHVGQHPDRALRRGQAQVRE